MSFNVLEKSSEHAALRRELGDEHIQRTRAHERPEPKVNRAVEIPGEERIAGSVRRDGDPKLVVSVAKSLTPSVPPCGVELREEHIPLASARQRTPAEFIYSWKYPATSTLPAASTATFSAS